MGPGNRPCLTLAVAGVLTVCGGALLHPGVTRHSPPGAGATTAAHSMALPALTPWAGVGGCGVGAGSGPGAASVMWIGRGVRGGLVDVEARAATAALISPRMGIAQSRSFSVPLTVTVRPRIFDIGLSVPLQWKLTQLSDNAQAQTGGVGDLNLTLARPFGPANCFQASAGITLPTGKSDIHDLNHTLVPSIAQMGGGVFGATLGLDYTNDREWGVIVAGGGYSAGLLYIQSTDILWDDKLKRAVPDSRALAWARVGSHRELLLNEDGDTVPCRVGPGAANDMGVVSPDNINLRGYVGFRRESHMHSIGLQAAIPLGSGRYDAINYQARRVPTATSPTKDQARTFVNTSANYVRANGERYRVIDVDTVTSDWRVEQRSPRPQKAWMTVTPSYGLEFSHLTVPIFVAASLPIEFNGDQGVAVRGFSAELGMKFIVY